jgi:6-phosphogluconolactonase
MPLVTVFDDAATLGVHAAGLIAGLSAAAVAARGRFTVALSGGSLPGIIGSALVAEPWLSTIAWPAWHVFFADERCVPPDHPDSNYRLANQTFLGQVPVNPSRIYTIDDHLSPAGAARAYEQALRGLFGGVDWPRLDLLLLGMGPDGHTASLFPGHRLLAEREKWVAAITDSPKPPPARITLTLPVLNHAAAVVFVVTGGGKAERLPQALQPYPTLPAGMVRDGDEPVRWLVDRAAAANLPDDGE